METISGTHISKVTCKGMPLEACTNLIQLYTDELGVDLQFQGLQAELDDLLEIYGAPNGKLLLATTNGKPSGCVAYKQVANGVCEMKRLFTLPSFREKGIASQLVHKLIEEAKHAGFQKMVLDSLSRLTPAIQLYRMLGFVDCPPYYYNPLPGVVFMEKYL